MDPAEVFHGIGCCVTHLCIRNFIVQQTKVVCYLKNIDVETKAIDKPGKPAPMWGVTHQEEMAIENE